MQAGDKPDMFYVVLLIAAAIVGYAGILMWHGLQAAPQPSLTAEVRHARRRLAAGVHRLKRSDRSAGWNFGNATPGHG